MKNYILNILCILLILNKASSTDTNAQTGTQNNLKTKLENEKMKVLSQIKVQNNIKTNLKVEANLKEKKRLSLDSKSGAISLFTKLYNTEEKSNISKNFLNTENVLQDWLMISSPIFLDTKKFPPLLLPDGQTVKIKIDSNYFRINEVNKIEQIKDKMMKPPTDKHFWFRLSGKHLYYSLTPKDLNVLGAISLSYIESVKHSATGDSDYCFTVTDADNQYWKLCTSSKKLKLKWMCKLQTVLKQKVDSFCNNESGIIPLIPTVVEKRITQPIIIIPLPSPMCNEGWSYTNKGTDWNCECSEGKEQSPIDLPSIDKAIDSSIKPFFQYDNVSPNSKSDSLELEPNRSKNKILKIKLQNNVLKISDANFGKLITLDGAVYKAKEIVIHTPAEHTINGKKYDMEVQVIHYGQSKGDIGKQAILSFIFEKKPGVYNKFLDDIEFLNLPNPLSKEVELTHDIFIPKILYNTQEFEENGEVFSMKPFSFYTYQGSLTSPPCSERTILYIASKPLHIGTTAFQLFQEALRVPDIMNNKGDVIISEWIPSNNREIQPLNGRPVFHYDHVKYCGPDPVKHKPKPEGHYEKVSRSSTEYFYVNDSKPSGLPNAFVVSEKEAKGDKFNDILNMLK